MRNLRCLFYIIVTVLYACFQCSTAEDKCAKKNMCYDCNSVTDKRCKDPFNASDKPPVEACHGCCTKIVIHAGDSNEVIRRSCSKSLTNNLFVKDLNCDYESEGMGHMCFCDHDYCNGVQTQHSISAWVPLICAFLGTMLLGTQHWRILL